MSMSLFFPIDDSLTNPGASSRAMALLGPARTCKSSLAFGIAFKLLGEDVDAGRDNTNIVYITRRRIELPPLHVHHMPQASLGNEIANRIRIDTIPNLEELLDLTVHYHDLERKTVPRAFILDDLHLFGKQKYAKNGEVIDSQKFILKIIANFLDLSNFYSRKFNVPCYVIFTADDDVRADVGCCVPVARNLIQTVIHVKQISPEVLKSEEGLEEKTKLRTGDVVKYKMCDVNNGFVAYFKIEELEIFYERLCKVR